MNKKIFIIVALVFILLTSNVDTAAAKRVGIQAGHYPDAGANACEAYSTTINEKDINWAITNKAAEMLRQRGYTVDIIVAYNKDLDKIPGSKSYIDYVADVFIALHTDYCADTNSGFKVSRYGGAKGTGKVGNGDASDKFVDILRSRYGQSTGLSWDSETGHYPVGFTHYYALNPDGGIADSTPGVVMEMGWISGDFTFMTSDNGQQKMATGIADAVEEFLSLSTTDLNSGLSPEDLVKKLLGPGVTVSDVKYYGVNHAAGTFKGGTGIIGFEDGIILSTGKISDVAGPNMADDTTTSNGQPGDSDLDSLISGYTTFDRSVLEFDFIPNTDVLTFEYVFGSEEYNEYVHSAFNNIFGFFINGKNVALIPGTTTPVSINNVNGGNPYGSANAKNKEYFRNNDLDDGGGSTNTELDGLTTVLKVTTNVNAGVKNHIKLAIADAGDSILDSDVFIKSASFSSPKMAELAKSVIGKNYKLQKSNAFTKGWKKGRFVDSAEIEYLDCSGLIFWSYNIAYDAKKYQSTSNPVYYEGADGQFRNDFTVDVAESDLLPGDALFFDWNKDGIMDHVAMYVGSYSYDGTINDIKYEGTYDVVNALNPTTGIKPDKVANLKEEDGFIGFRRLAKSIVGISFNSHSPVDLIITDPDGNKISKDTWEIPGIFYYSEYDMSDGDTDDIITAPVKKKGYYSITVVKEPSASPTNTYTLEVSTEEQNIILADDVLIGNSPTTYMVKSTDAQLIPLIRQGGVSISIIPRSNSVINGNSIIPNIKINNTQNIDDNFRVYISVDGIPTASRADLGWFNWTEKYIDIKSGENINIPINITIPKGITGTKVFRARVNSTTSDKVYALDTGYLKIS